MNAQSKVSYLNRMSDLVGADILNSGPIGWERINLPEGFAEEIQAANIVHYRADFILKIHNLIEAKLSSFNMVCLYPNDPECNLPRGGWLENKMILSRMISYCGNDLAGVASTYYLLMVSEIIVSSYGFIELKNRRNSENEYYYLDVIALRSLLEEIAKIAKNLGDKEIKSSVIRNLLISPWICGPNSSILRELILLSHPESKPWDGFFEARIFEDYFYIDKLFQFLNAQNLGLIGLSQEVTESILGENSLICKHLAAEAEFNA